MMAIIQLQRRMAHKGRIRMGRKEGKRPVKLNNWRLTSTDKTCLEEAARIYGGTVRAWAERQGEFELITDVSELPVMLLPGQTLSQWMELWSGGGCQRRCDGANDTISDGPCLCDPDQPDCKPHTRLNVMLPDLRSLGMWRLDSTGWNAASELAGTAEFLEQATSRGVLLPARLRIDQRVQVKDGQTKKFGVPVLDVDVRSLDALQIAGVTLRELDAPDTPIVPLLEAPKPEVPSGYTPVAQIGPAGVTVDAALDAVALEAAPRARTARSAAPLGPEPDDIGGSDPIPVEEPEPIDAPAAPPIPASAAQKKKLNVLVGKLRDAGAIDTRHLWAALAKQRSFETDQMITLLGGEDADGLLHWGPLRDSLSRDEASALIERLVAAA